MRYIYGLLVCFVWYVGSTTPSSSGATVAMHMGNRRRNTMNAPPSAPHYKNEGHVTGTDQQIADADRQMTEEHRKLSATYPPAQPLF